MTMPMPAMIAAISPGNGHQDDAMEADGKGAGEAIIVLTAVLDGYGVGDGGDTSNFSGNISE